MDFRICGHVLVRIGDDWTENWGHPKARGVLGVLLTKPGRTFPDHTLVEWLWGRGTSTKEYSNALQNYIGKIRRTLKTLQPPVLVERRHNGYRVAVEAEQVDYYCARSGIKAARSAREAGDLHHARALLDEALALLDEPPLLELPTERADSFRATTETHLVLPAANQLLTVLLKLGEPESALAKLDDLQESHPDNLSLIKRRIDALRASDGFYEATEYFQRAYAAFRGKGMVDEADELRQYQNAPAAEHSQRRLPPVADQAPAYRIAPRRLPHDRVDLVGRAELLDQLDSHTDRGRAAKVIVLSGTAGIGKTALAVHWAHRIPAPSGGILYADLQGFSNHPRWEASDVVRKFLHEFQVPADRLRTEEARQARLSSLLNQQHTVLVLDNVNEPEQVTPLLDLAPNTLLLITSRRHQDHLTMHWGATEIHIPTITADAGESWLHKAVGTRGTDEPEAFADLVSLCGGIPLVYNLISTYIAARPHASLADIATDLREEHRLLTIGDTAGSFDTTLHATFLLSYRALSLDARRLLRRLSHHPLPSFARGVAIALNGVDRNTTLDHLDELIRANLLEQHNSHYQWHDLIHDFAIFQAMQDSSTDRSQAVTNMVGWYLTTAHNAEVALLPFRPNVPPLGEPNPAADKFRDEQDAFQWFVQERHALLSVLRLAHDEGLHGHVWRLANKSNEAFKRYGHYHDALTGLQLALSSLGAQPDTQAHAGTLNNIGYICTDIRDFSTAHDHFQRTYELSLDSGDPQSTAIALHNLAYVNFRTGNYADADRQYTQALRIATEKPLHYVRANTLRRFGQLQFARGELATASTYYHESLALQEKIENTQGIGQVLCHMAELHLKRDELSATVDFADRALGYHHRSNDLTTLAESLKTLAQAHQRLGKHQSAIEYARESCRVCGWTRNVETEAAALDALAASLLTTGRRDVAIEQWKRAEELYRDLGDDGWITVRDKLREVGA